MIAGPAQKAAPFAPAGGSPRPEGRATAELAGAVDALRMILQVEREARRATTLDELWFVIANEARRALGARQILLLSPVAGRGLEALAISNVSKVDRDSSTVRWLEELAQDATAHVTATRAIALPVDALAAGSDPSAAAFPFRNLLVAPMNGRDGVALAWMMAVRETPFGDNECACAERLADTFAHAAEALGLARARKARNWRRPVGIGCGVLLIAALMLVQVPLTALAPAEVIARDAFVATVPIDGTVATIPVNPGQHVRSGDVLLTLVDTSQRNQLAIAEQEVAVAEAKWRQVSLAAFNDPTLRRELGVAANDLALKVAERDYAADTLSRTVVKAERDGTAIFADKRELIGRPVQAGQRLMDIANPSRLMLRVDAHVDDAIVLNVGTEMTFFPDADPLQPVQTVIAATAHQARQTESGTVAFRVDAEVPAEAVTRLRIGHRGTVQIRGEKVSLGFYLLRRPLSALRQRFGL